MKKVYCDYCGVHIKTCVAGAICENRSYGNIFLDLCDSCHIKADKLFNKFESAIFKLIKECDIDEKKEVE
jgi:hypothetical protein